MSQREELQAELVEMKAIYDLPDYHLFAIWCMAKLHYDGDIASEQTLEDAYASTYQLLNEDGPGDQKLDGFYFDEAATTAYLYQVCWPILPTSIAPLDKACELATAFLNLHNDINHQEELGEARAQAAAALEKVLTEGGEVVLRGLSGGQWNKAHVDQVRKQIPAELRHQVVIQLLELPEIYKLIAQKYDDLHGEVVEFAILEPGNDVLQYAGPNYSGLRDAIIAVISGKSLATIGKNKGTSLYERNVRHFLGNKRVNSALAPLIADVNKWPSFWYGHNGITVICDDFNFSPKEKSKSARILVTNPQIVNGCQTVSTLADAQSAINAAKEDFGVTARFIKVKGDGDTKDECAGLIAYATNNQAAVVDADLLSNHPVQKLFQNKLANFDQGWFYERKRGEWGGLAKARKQKYKAKGQADRLIGREHYQQAFRAYEGKPSEAVTKKNAVWFAGGTEFELVFGSDQRACDIVLVSTLFDWYLQVFRVKANGSLCCDINPTLAKHVDQIKRARNLLAAHSVALHGFMVRKAYAKISDYPQASVLKIVRGLQRGSYVAKTWKPSGKNNSWAVIDGSVRRVMKAWGYYLAQEVKVGSSLYSFLKQPEALQQLQQLLENDITSDGVAFNTLLEAKSD